jgi:RimJ/RimL family protein N-acetyltransferase
MMIETLRIRLRCWRESDREAFATMNADPEVMLDQGGPLSREKSDAKLDCYAAAFDRYGFCRWVTESRDANSLATLALCRRLQNIHSVRMLRSAGD